ncbi:hypothetical protein N474_22240 [Pseudoalteromonas luteoviolacea CPMOR-2]|uniref:Penicillin amidase n=1 Tax=Pseudoalteromonas luteoviolacea DSM 6061 TaxID=1365250 RepID=A0A167CBD0_9GAMM|nr:penicillin acylase family protein [Pseudoalteromonas luteoviolacea]KZN47461.1 hypothetical protein N475_06180 [Pseudoalteromonas luteoviolacea DSM 6061]KZN53057.1 hypothetical protein N474_22240 [Pseudoalteromonas luteoviolacea CPMOR-2]MBE0388647.1 penicillin amidase [Pseudoalteromonas luteoviolacea DSM 6061]
MNSSSGGHPILIRFGLFVFLPIIVLLLMSAWYIGQSLPKSTGESYVTGLTNSVKVSRDEDGIVYINAETNEDAYFALGYAHAQDRMWQLEFQRRIVQGRLSEVFGTDTVPYDAWMRTLGLDRAAKSSWEVLSPNAKASLTSYAAGINAWLEAKPQLPVEFEVLGITPEKWTEYDSLAWIKVFALNLSGNLSVELANSLSINKMSEEQRSQIYGDYPKGAPVTVSYLKQHSIDSLTALLQNNLNIEKNLKIGGKYVGSNAWVISGEHTANGAPLLANDPHLGLQLPSPWYVASLKGSTLNVTGMTLVGLPVVIFGRNEQVAWGGTNMMADTQDLYVEQLNPSNSSEYKYEGEWIQFETRTELVDVKAEFPESLRYPLEPVKVEVKTSVNGPIITGVNGAIDQPVALKWTALMPKDTSYESFFKANYAKNWDEFKHAFSFHVAPALNIVYADQDNNIAYIGIGKIPKRNHGNGQLPSPGWLESHQWKGFIPFEEMPSSLNPESGYLINANNKVADENYAYFISNDWAHPARAERIEQLIVEKIASGQKVDIDYTKRMHGDEIDISAVRLAKYLSGFKGETESQKDAIERLQNWSGNMAQDSIGATVFYMWVRNLREALFKDTFTSSWGEDEKQAILQSELELIEYGEVLTAIEQSPQDWCKPDGDCRSLILSSLDSATEQISKLVGGNSNDWQWGRLQKTTYEHSVFSRVNLLDIIFNREISNGGAPNTINVASGRFDKSEGFQQIFGASFRQIISMGKVEKRHLYMNSTGQSGNILSDHYDDMIKPFQEVKYFKLEKPSQTNHLLTLLPEINGGGKK